MAASQRWKNRGIGAAAAVLVGLGTIGSAGSAFAATDSKSGQIGGSDRYETAALLATSYWSSPSTVIVANGETGVDALTASYLAGVGDAPVLLTPAKATSKYTVDAIAALNPQKVIVIGGKSAVSDSVYAELTKGRTAQRITGADRYETAANIVAAAGTTPTSAFLAVGESTKGGLSADALAAGPIAYRAHIPILLTRSGDLPAATVTALSAAAATATTSGAGTYTLKAAGGLDKVVVVGGKNAVSDAVRTGAADVSGATTTRVSGADRSATAAQLAQSAEAQSADFSATTVSIVNGSSVDGLTAGPAAGKRGAPMLLTNSATDLGSGTQEYLTEHADTLTDITVVGGATAVPADLVKAISNSSGVEVPTTKPTVPAVTPSPTTTTPTTTTPVKTDRKAPQPDAEIWWWESASSHDVQVPANHDVQGNFNETLGAASTAKVVRVADPTGAPVSVPVPGKSEILGKDVLSFKPTENFTEGAKYSVTFSVVDLAGNKAEYTEYFIASQAVPGNPFPEAVRNLDGTTDVKVSFDLQGFTTDQLDIVRTHRVIDADGFCAPGDDTPGSDQTPTDGDTPVGDQDPVSDQDPAEGSGATGDAVPADGGVTAVDSGFSCSTEGDRYEETTLDPALVAAGDDVSFVDVNVPAGEYNYYLRLKEGNWSVGSPVLFVLPASPAAGPAVDAQTATTDSASYAVTGTATPGSTVALRMLSEQGYPAGGAVKVGEDGKFSITVGLDEGENEIFVRSFNANAVPSLPTAVTVTLQSA